MRGTWHRGVHALNKRLGAGFFGGEGFILQRLRGDGMAFLHAGGTIVQKQLNNESLRIDTGCIVAYAGQIDYSVEAAGGLKSMFFGGEGLFLATLRGTGTVWLQSLPFSRLANRILANAPAAGGNSRRSTLGQLGRMMTVIFEFELYLSVLKKHAKLCGLIPPLFTTFFFK